MSGSTTRTAGACTGASRPMPRRQRIALLGCLLAFSFACPAEDITVRTQFGFNLKQAAAAPYGSAPARRSLAELAALGVQEVALVVFLWQSGVDDDHIVLGDDASLPALAHAIRDAKASGLKVIIKPHVWVPGHWAGEVRPRNEDALRRWFADYERVLRNLAGV